MANEITFKEYLEQQYEADPRNWRLIAAHVYEAGHFIADILADRKAAPELARVATLKDILMLMVCNGPPKDADIYDRAVRVWLDYQGLKIVPK